MLMLHGNDISTVHPGAFYSLRSLQILKLSYNKLTSVSPGLFEGLAGLVRLHLDRNLIGFIEPYSFSGLTSLKLLQLEGNLLKEIHPHTFITVSLLGTFWTSGLKHLHLSDNLLEQLPDAALKMAPRLELLTLHGNPWTCDCQLHWLVEWNSRHEGVIKCKKERDLSNETCPQCSSPQTLNGTAWLALALDKLTCERPALRSPLKQWDSPIWAETEAEPDLPYTRDFEKPLGHLIFVLSDSHGNNAHVACDVRHPAMTDKIDFAENGDLLILNATLSDSGLYHCMVRTNAGVDLAPIRLTIKERSLSPTAFNGQKIVIEKGHSFSLPCDVTSVQPSQTMWYLPRNHILLPTQQTRRVEVMENGTLVVKRVTQEDAGEYSCVTSNLHGVDMLAHMVEVTGEKDSDNSKVQTEKLILTIDGEEGEGSGGDYQEIKRPFTTQLPKKVGTQQRNPVVTRAQHKNGNNRNGDDYFQTVHDNDHGYC
ncbi:hypothetical protein LDENG_00141850 [Lucifuga dentata]|nr:hypothetical protein LDENG_00141850 [Lucifuga dentata]